jgi:hypothetical protein
MMRCVHCDTELVAPVRSEYWSDKHACHIWLCPKCCACFSSVVSFPADTDTEFNEGYPDREPFTVSAAAGRIVREFHMTRQTISRLSQ